MDDEIIIENMHAYSLMSGIQNPRVRVSLNFAGILYSWSLTTYRREAT